METFDSNTSNAMDQTTQIYVKKILAGSVGDVRRRVIASVEAVGYDVIEDEPHIIGRRGARGWAIWYSSADVLDYPMTLTIRLKSVGQNSTRVTFDYLIVHPFLNKGEKAIVAQEAKTIASLSKKQAIEKMCSVCETESTNDSKFCRRCGAPMTTEQSDLEILRMMAETRAAKTSVVSAAVFTLISVVLFILAVVFSYMDRFPDVAPILIITLFGAASALSAVLCGIFGWNRINRALNKPAEQKEFPSRYVPDSVETGEFAEMSPHPAPPFITEGTTNLLDDEWTANRSTEKVPVPNRRSTNDLN